MKFKKMMAGVLSASLLMSAMPAGIPAVSAAGLPDPVMRVTFDDATAKDITGRGNDGNVVGSPEFVKGVSGKAIHIVNSSDVAGTSAKAEQYVDFGMPEDLQFGSEDFSLSFWFKTDPHDKEGAVISNKDWNSGSNPGFNIGDMNQGLNLNFNTEALPEAYIEALNVKPDDVVSGGDLTDNGEQQIQGADGAVSANDLPGNVERLSKAANTKAAPGRIETDRFAQASDGEWHHIAAVFDRDGDMVLYIDGTTYEPGNYNNNPASLDISGRKGSSIDVLNFVLGADGNFQNSASSIYIDELSVYKYALSKEQVVSLGRIIDDPAQDPNLVLKVTFDDATARDITGRGNDGNVVGNPEFIKGVSGKAIHIANSSDVAGNSKLAEQYVDFGMPEDLTFGTGDFSVSFWFKTDPHDKEGSVISNKNWNSGGNPGFNIGDMNQGLNLNFNTDSSLGRIETDRFGQASDGKWHHIAAVFDRDGDMILYIDGTTYAPGNFNSNPAKLDISGRKDSSIDALKFVLGADGNFQNSASSIYIDELYVYKSALSKEQVAALGKIAEDPESGSAPVLKVNFDNNTAEDSSGNHLDGQVAGSPEFVDGVEGKAIHLVNPDGVAAEGKRAEQYVNFGSPEKLLFGADDFTIMFWYMSDGDDPSEVSVVSNKDWGSGSNKGFTIGDMRNGMTLNFRADGSDGRVDTSRYGGATEKDKWHHIAAVFNRTGNMILYVDGQNAASASISGQAGKSIDVADFVLGADGLMNYGVKDSYIDELMVYRTALSQEEISNYNAPYVLRNKLAEYRKMAEVSAASPEKIKAFKAAIEDISRRAEGVTDLAVIAVLTEELKAAYNAFTGPEDGIVHFEVISDTHISGTDNNNATNQKLIDVMEDLKRDYPDTSVIFNCGDFSQDGNETQVKGYFNIIGQYNKDFTFMTALGNHDVRWKSGWDEIYERYMRYNGQYMGDTDGKVYYDKWIDGYHFIVLNTEWDIKDRAYISPEQLEWLDKTMAEDADPSKPIFIAFHQAMRDTYAISNDWSVGVQDYELKEVLRKYPQTIMFTGHIHDGLGAIEVIQTDYGTMVDVPSLKDNDQGDPRGQLGFHVSVYENEVRLDLRDYLNDEWVPEYSYHISMDPASRPLGKVLDVNFDDKTADDNSGNGNNGTIYGSPEFVADSSGGKALHIVNSDAVATQEKKAEQYVDFGNQIQFGTDDFTIMFSYKGEVSGDGDGCIIANKNWNSGGNPGFAIGAFAGSNKGMGLNFNTEGNSRADTSRYGAATDGEWHEIAAVFERDAQMTLYIDGQKAGSKDISSQSGNKIDAEGMKLILGADGNYQNAARDFYIDNLKVYKKALGAAELETAYNPYKVETSSDSVTISWSLDENDYVEPAYLALDGKKVTDISSGETSKTITGLTPGKTYTVLLVNHEKGRPSNYRDVYPFVVTAKSLLPEVPSGIAADNITEESAEISWNAVDGADGYYVYRNGQRAGDLVAGTSFVLTGLDPAVQYEVTVSAVNSAGESAQSAVCIFTTKEKETVSKKTLKFYLDKAKEHMANGDTDGCVTSVQKLFKEAIAQGEKVMEKENAAKQDILDAQTKLMLAIQGLDMKAGDKTDLKMALEMTANIDLTKYVEAGQAEYLAAKENAEKTKDDGDAMQETVDDAWNRLVNAIEDLRLKADKSSLERLLEAVKDLDLSKFTEETASVFRTAYAAADALMKNETLSEDDQSQVDSAVQALQAAKDGLKLKETGKGDDNVPDNGTDDGNQDGDAATPSDQGSENNTGGTVVTITSPATGDLSLPTGYILLTAIIGAALIGFSLTSRKKK